MPRPSRTVVLLLALAALPAAAIPASSNLWGTAGERWDPSGRLPDFSFAGYRSGDRPVPTYPVTAKVTDFGAIPDDSVDDTAAFSAAVKAAGPGALLVPKGRYILTDIISIRRSGVVLRGEGPGTVLFFPKGLEQIHPSPTTNTSGKPVSGYSWSGGFLTIQGSITSKPLAAVAQPAPRGARQLTVADAAKLRQGMEILVEVHDDAQKTLLAALYAGDPGNTSKIPAANFVATQPARVAAIDGNRVTLDRPLRYELRPEWKPTVSGFEASVAESGIESLTFEFPERPYGGHFTEVGYNAVALTGVRDCWVRDIEIVNADSGIHANSRFCTFEGLTFRTTPGATENRGCFGHHGVCISGTDNLITRFDFRHRFIHDLTSTKLAAGNVFSNGKGVDLCFDHHKRAPHGNLFTNIDLGAGTRPWQSGGGADLGRHCGAWTTFWGIRSAATVTRKPDWSPALVNFVGVPLADPASVDPKGLWIESPTEAISPANLHEAQLKQRRAKAGIPAEKRD